MLSIIVSVGLVAPTVLSILHIVVAAALDLELWDLNNQLGVVGLLIVGIHVKLSKDYLVLVDAEGLR